MYVETEGIVLRQVKTVNSRRMVLLFSQRFGKISAGTGFTEKGKGKSALAMRPFTLGQYELYKGRDTYNINKAQAVKSYYAIGEDIDKYMASSYVLEWTEKILEPDNPSPAIYKQLIEFFDSIVERKKDYDTLILAYQIKVIKILGCMPELNCCSNCGKEAENKFFDIATGGIVCNECGKKLDSHRAEKLIYSVKFDIINTLRYLGNNPLSALENIGLKPDVAKALRDIIVKYSEYHLDVAKIKSQNFLNNIRR